ncbi:MAG: 1-acyl-sn-glycerol-3-phosphate acyltransferase [Clostridia bacterium]|nr:1-acyl-sn-glycerol-3-phosphate acyltransferase [Clostridia bacterium]
MLYAIYHWFVRITGYIPQLILFRTKVHYEDKSVQSRFIRSKAIVVSNHNGLMDFGVLLFVFWSRILRCAVAEITFDKNIFLKLILKPFGCVRVDRDSYDMVFLDKMKKILNRGGVVEIYPESRIPSKDEKKPIAFKPSYVLLALESGAPIIPIYNNGKMLSSERRRIVIGKPIDVSSLYDDSLSERENIRIINDYVRSKIIELGQQIEKTKEKAI